MAGTSVDSKCSVVTVSMDIYSALVLFCPCFKLYFPYVHHKMIIRLYHTHKNERKLNLNQEYNWISTYTWMDLQKVTYLFCTTFPHSFFIIKKLFVSVVTVIKTKIVAFVFSSFSPSLFLSIFCFGVIFRFVGTNRTRILALP